MIHVGFGFVCATGLFPAAFHPIRRDAGEILTACCITDCREISRLGSARVSRAGERVLERWLDCQRATSEFDRQVAA
jgi:hypothetical protein